MKRKNRWDFYGTPGCCLTCPYKEPGCMCSSVRCRACVFWFYSTLHERGKCEIAEVLRLDLTGTLDADQVHIDLLAEKEVEAKVVKVSELSQYVQAGVDVKTGDVVRFVDAGVIRKAEETPFGRDVFQITVELPNGTQKIMTVNRTSQRNLAAAYGDDTENWVGEQAVVTIVKQNVRGTMKDVIYLNPLQKKLAPKK